MNDWRNTTLGAVINSGGSIKTGPFGTTLKASEYADVGVPVISVGEIGYGLFRLRQDTRRVSSETTTRLAEYVLEVGDIVFGRKGAVDRSAHVGPDEHGWFLGSDGIRVRLPRFVSSEFVSYQLLLESTKTWLLQHASGSTMLSLNQGTLERVPLSIPAFDKQNAIVEVLSALDDKITANTKLAATADDLAATISSRAFAAGLEVSLSDIAEITMGSSPAGASFNESGQGSVFHQGIRDFGLRYPNQRVWTDAPVRMARKLDTLFSVRAPVGRANLTSEAVCIGRGIASLHPRHGTPYTLFHAVKNSTVWHQFNSEGTVFGSINRRQLESSRLRWLPAEALQAHEASLRSLEQVIRSNIEMSKALEATRDALLPQLMSGKLGVKHAEEVVAAAI